MHPNFDRVYYGVLSCVLFSVAIDCYHTPDRYENIYPRPRFNEYIESVRIFNIIGGAGFIAGLVLAIRAVRT